MGKLAIIQTGGKQYKVQEGKKIRIEKLEGVLGSPVAFQEVLLTSDEDGKNVRIGTPHVEGAAVKGTITKQGRLKKITVIKFKRKVRYRRKRGHRQHFTEIEITTL